MYSIAATERRECRGQRKDGQRCNAWAMWDSTDQLCAQHAGHGHRGTQMGLQRRIAWEGSFESYWRDQSKREHAHYIPCRCKAWPFPHRPGAGKCNWPNEHY